MSVKDSVRVRSNISLGGHITLHVFLDGTVTAETYRKAVFDTHLIACNPCNYKREAQSVDHGRSSPAAQMPRQVSGHESQSSTLEIL
ncbi:hypothetical protein AVEN_35449-1 [Araneus ventricosus]|uniref:Uncharacterized protein n=1 Tax=Araneus ventricosus TaxID=182803 RepID=A0A4Y2WTI8_ARAVE|nr:hypothetical protein AVEN_35449-1 [Araneus ventricosus]